MLNDYIQKIDRLHKFISDQQLDNYKFTYIPTFEYDYWISYDGAILISLCRDRPHIMSAQLDKDGYQRVQLRDGRNYAIHRLVLWAWSGNYYEGFEVHHRDLQEDNNNYSNLQPLTLQEHRTMHRLLDQDQQRLYNDSCIELENDYC